MKKTSKKQKEETPAEGTGKENLLRELFIENLKDIYWAEQAIVKALPKMIQKVTSEDLAEALENHLRETEEQVKKVEKVFEIMGETPKSKKCEGMDGLLKEGEEIMADTEEGGMRDAGIIAAAQKVEHYEIASYGTLRTYAEELGLTEAAEILQDILNEEKASDGKLTQLAEASVNMEAAHEEGEEE